MQVYLFRIFLLFSVFVLHLWGSDAGELLWTHPGFQSVANQQDDTLYRLAENDRLAFWEKCAHEIDWFKKWNKLYEWKMPYAKWYLDGKLNISYNCLDRHLEKNGDKVAYIWCSENGDERKITYRELHEEVCRLANGLKSLGVKKGDVVAIYMPMVPEGIASMLACARIGAVHSVIFGGTGRGSTLQKIEDANAKVVITADVGHRRGKMNEFGKVIASLIDEIPSVENVVCLKRADTPMPSDKFIDYKALLERSDRDCPPEHVDAEDLLFVLYTSGTTGKPKGILHTTGGYLVGVHNTFKWVFDYKQSDVFWCTADIGWITGHSYVVYGPMSNGATQVIYEGAFDYPGKEQAWKIIEKYGVTTFYTAPTLIRIFMKWGEEAISKYDTQSLRLLGSIGEPLNPEAWHWYHKHVGSEKCPIVDTWFQTETGSFVIAPIPGVTPLKPGSVTWPLPGYQTNIFGEVGEVQDHGYLAILSHFPSMMRGVLNNPQRYYDTYWKKWDGKHYFAGDDATVDRDGYIWVRGRADEVMQIAGHRIGTAEMENVIVHHPGVSESAVTGVFDEIKGERVISLVVLKDGTVPSQGLAESIAQYVSDHIGKYACPEHVIFVKDLPKTRSGKILRRLIRNLIEGNAKGDLSTLQNPHIIDELECECIKIGRKIYPGKR